MIFVIKLLAHLTTHDGIRKEQTLKEHCVKAAEYAVENIEQANLYHTVYLATLLHDMGKATFKFNDYLEAAHKGQEVVRGSVNHTFAGVIYLFEKFHQQENSYMEKLTCEIISYAIGAHHGLFDCVNLSGENGFVHRLKKNKETICYKEALHNFLEEVLEKESIEERFCKAAKEVEEFYNISKELYEKKGTQIFFQISMLIRLVLSTVIYGDRKDTAAFMEQRTAKEVERSWQERKDFFEKKMTKMDSSSELNQVRAIISEQCLAFAKKTTGIYRLCVPTGGGKTLCMLRYALAHAMEFQKKRIIFIVPLLSILDQNVKVIRDYVEDKDEVLEHHSNVVRENVVPEQEKEELDAYECLTEDWNAPIIVSTLVQLLNILFQHTTSSIRRMQALCNSVIVIDEVQSLPKKVTEMFNMAMNFLSHFCNATILLTSATQPCFEELKWPLHFAKEPDIVKLSEDQLKLFDRVTIINKINPYGMKWEEFVRLCSELLMQHSSVLVVCNTKVQARKLYQEFRTKETDAAVFHLSAAMCQEHRKDVLEEMQVKLSKLQEARKKGEPFQKLFCVSTPVIEAGVDISFEAGVRILAGIDSLSQTAGRINRSYEYGSKGKLVFLNLQEENLGSLDDLILNQKSTRWVLRSVKEGEELHLTDTVGKQYYMYLFKKLKEKVKYLVNIGSESYSLMALLANARKIEGESILNQPFQTVGRNFRVFDEDTVDAVVPYKEGKELIRKLQNFTESPEQMEELKAIIKQAKRYTINLYEEQKEKMLGENLLTSLFEERVYILDEKAYDNGFGQNDIQKME